MIGAAIPTHHGIAGHRQTGSLRRAPRAAHAVGVDITMSNSTSTGEGDRRAPGPMLPRSGLEETWRCATDAVPRNGE